jgi:hypothetical protein
VHQLALGASFAFVVGLAVYAFRRGRASLRFLLFLPAFMALGALWAIVPDLPRAVGWSDLYYRMSTDPRSDIFFWHYSIDLVERHAPWHAPLVLLMMCTLLAMAWRELRLRERERP